MRKERKSALSMFWVSYSVLFFIGGLGFARMWVPWYGLVFSGFCLLLLFSQREKLYFPKYFLGYFVFLLFFLASFIWSKDFYVAFINFLMFLTGAVFWVLFYNVKNSKNAMEILQKVVLGLGLLYGLWYVWDKISGGTLVRSFSLINYSSPNLNHHHIGDYWALGLLTIIHQIIFQRKKNFSRYLLLILASYIVITSGSRSSYVALAGGLLLLLKNSKVWKRGFVLILGLLSVLLVGFWLVSSQKELIVSRIYYIQSISGLNYYPLGVGVGNFSFISEDLRTHAFGFEGFSVAVHNIVLEMVSGIGILALPFIYWFLKVISKSIQISKKEELLPKTLVLALSTNFFFDFTYFIPTMLWLWFSLMGIMERNAVSENVKKFPFI